MTFEECLALLNSVMPSLLTDYSNKLKFKEKPRWMRRTREVRAEIDRSLENISSLDLVSAITDVLNQLAAMRRGFQPALFNIFRDPSARMGVIEIGGIRFIIRFGPPRKRGGAQFTIVCWVYK